MRQGRRSLCGMAAPGSGSQASYLHVTDDIAEPDGIKCAPNAHVVMDMARIKVVADGCAEEGRVLGDNADGCAQLCESALARCTTVELNIARNSRQSQ